MPRRVHEIDNYNAEREAGPVVIIGCFTARVNAVKSRGQPYTTLHVGRGNLPLHFKVDTCSEIKVLPITTFGKLPESLTKRLNPTHVRLRGYDGHEVPTACTCRMECNLRDKTHSREFFVADTTSTHIIGFDSCSIIGVVLTMTRAEVAAIKTDNALENIPKDIAERYSEIFHGIGQFQRTHSIQTSFTPHNTRT